MISALFLVILLAMIFFWLSRTESGLRWALSQASGVIEVESVSGTLLTPTLNGLAIDLEGATVRAARAKLSWRLLPLLNKTVQINSLLLEQVDVTLKEQGLKEAQPYQPWSGLDIPISIEINRAIVAQFRLRNARETLFNFDKLDLSAAINNNLLSIKQLDLRASDNTLSLIGRVDLGAAPSGRVDLEHDVGWTVSDQRIASTGSLSGTWASLTLTQALSSPVAVELAASVDNALSDLLSWTAEIKTSEVTDQLVMGEALSIGQGEFQSSGQFAPAVGLPGLRAAISGNLSGSNDRFSSWQLAAATEYFEGDLTIEQLRFESQDELKPRHLVAQGVVNNALAFIGQENGTGTVDLNGQWSDMQWPFTSESPDIVASGQFNLTGSSDEYRLIATADGVAHKQGLDLNVDMRLSPQSMVFDQFVISSGATRGIISGTVTTDYDIRWDFQSPNIGDLLADARGDLTSKGVLTGARDQPNTQFNADSKSIAFAGYELSDLTLNADLSLASLADNLDITLTAKALSSATRTIADSLNVSLTGTGLQHALAIDGALAAGADVSDRTFSIRAAGGIDDELWIGQVSKLTLFDPVIQAWALDAPAKLVAGKDSLSVSKSCLKNAAQSICFAAEQNQQGLVVNGELAAVSLANLNDFVRSYDFKASGLAEGEFSYTKNADSTSAQIDAFLESSAANVNWLDAESLDNERQQLNIALIRLKLNQADALDVVANVLLESGDLLDFDLSVDAPLGAAQFGSAALNGSGRIALNKLEDLPPSLINDVSLNGGLTGDVVVSGTVESPDLRVSADINNATARISELDLVLRNINIHASSDRSAIINLSGNLMSGEGQLDVAGTIDLSQANSPKINLQSSGKNLQFINTTGMDVVGDVDLKATLSNQLIDLQGNIKIVQAELDFKMPENAILASDDVVLVGDTPQARVKQKLDLSIDLGQNTHIQAQGLDAKLTGELRVFQEPNNIVRGEGEINIVDGRYRAYGQDLKIDTGRLIFNRGSVDDPNLDMRAQKTVDSVVAGVSVAGRARAPVLDLYSTPSMSDQDILSVLVFDKTLNKLGSQDGLTLLNIANSFNGGGESQITKTTQSIRDTLGLTDLELQLTADAPSIQAGKQLSSKFYIGYGYGLLDAAQSFILKYKLSDTWSIKADVGVESGADLRYEIER